MKPSLEIPANRFGAEIIDLSVYFALYFLIKDASGSWFLGFLAGAFGIGLFGGRRATLGKRLFGTKNC